MKVILLLLPVLSFIPTTIESGAGEQFLPQGSMAKARLKEVFLSQTPARESPHTIDAPFFRGRASISQGRFRIQVSKPPRPRFLCHGRTEGRLSDNIKSVKNIFCQTPVGLSICFMFGRALQSQPGVGSPQPQDKY